MRIVLADPNGELISAWMEESGGKEYVSTYRGSIFDVKCDAIVSPANSFGIMDGGIDLAYSNFFGWSLQERLRDIIRTKHHGELLVGAAEIVPTEHPEIPYMISAPTMRVPMTLANSVNPYLAVRAVLLLVKHGTFDDGSPISERVRTVALPGMGTGVGGMRKKDFAKQMRRALEDFVEERFVFPATWKDTFRSHESICSGPTLKEPS